MSKTPYCSIIIPTRRRPAQLERCLEALCGLEYPRFEVIVVDDGGGIDLRSALERFRSRLALTLHVQARTGPAGARNAGAERARGEVLAFTDDDCVPAHDWLRRLVEELVARPNRGVGGHTVNALPENLFSSTSQMVIDVGYEQNNRDPGEARFFTSNNLAVPSRTFQSLGGFDETFMTSEDRDFCDRWVARGYPLEYVPKAVVYHAHELTVNGFVRQHFAYGRGAFRFHKAHARRWRRRVTIEPSFYMRLFVYPFRNEPRRRAWQIAALLQLWNLANTAGFFWEASRSVQIRRRLTQRRPEAPVADVENLQTTAPSEHRKGRARERIDLSDCEVLHVVWPGDYGGVLTHIAGYVRAASRDGDLVHRVCFLDGAGPTGDALGDEGMSFRLGFRRGWGPLGLLRFARALRSARPSVVHFHWRALGAIAVARVVLPRTPFVWTEHHPGAVTSGPRTRLFYRLFHGCFCRVVVTSDVMARYVEGFGIDRELIRVIPQALTVPLRRPETPMPSRGNVVGVITRLDGPKRVDLFIDVLAELRDRGVACSGVVVGDGGHKEIYEEHARRSGLGDVVRFVGMSSDVEGWLDRFDVFLTTSSVETFGLAALEAMARGVPVVAMPSSGGLSDLVERGGVLVRDRAPRSAADAVESLLASAAERARVGGRGYAIATAHTLDAAVSRHTSMYRELTADARRPQALVSG